ncbi:response regulator [Nitrospira sp. Kam-Ns4a]
MNPQDQNGNQVILVAVNDVFFYTKLRDALRGSAYTLERARTQDDVPAKTAPAAPAALVINLNEERLDPFRAIEDFHRSAAGRSLPILAFANHEEVETWRRAKELGVTKIVSRNEFSARTKELIEEVISRQLSASRSGKQAER